MSTGHLIRPTWRVIWGCAADDPYSAWYNAEQRCSEALREWREAASPSARAAAYLAYCFAIDLEERAAAQLARAVGPPLAA
jgi:hypothetical protein